jgi:hypothetical protein
MEDEMEIPKNLAIVRFGAATFVGIAGDEIVGTMMTLNKPRVLSAVTGQLSVTSMIGAPDPMYFMGGYAWGIVVDEVIARKYIENTSGIKLAAAPLLSPKLS